MAKTSSNKKNDKNNITNINQDKAFRRQLNNINSMIGQANLTMYGTDRTSDVDTLNKKFQKLHPTNTQLDHPLIAYKEHLHIHKNRTLIEKYTFYLKFLLGLPVRGF